jgi:YidC/Oxa1 family membrane protein insertase
LGQNLGLAIIALTVAIRLVLIPLTKPSLDAARKMRDLAPEIGALKKKHKDNKQALAQAQMELYRKHNINPAAGCLPQIIQIVVLIALFQAFTQVLNTNGETIDKLNSILYPALKLVKENTIHSQFFYLNLTKPDMFNLPFSLNLLGLKLNQVPGLFLIGSAVTQYLSSKIMMPVVKKEEAIVKKTEGKEDDMAVMMQKQMLYLMPVMTLIIGFNFPSGLVLYWLTFSLFMLGQELVAGRKK